MNCVALQMKSSKNSLSADFLLVDKVWMFCLRAVANKLIGFSPGAGGRFWMLETDVFSIDC